MDPLTSDAPLIVYLDFKSPYAYLAREPTVKMARELGIRVDWRPFVLDIPSFLGSARLDAAGRVVAQSRTAEQWSSVKYAYFDCRRYASLRGVTVRGTTKIWDTQLASVGMLWARAQSDAILGRYIDAVYEPFWKRELDLEDLARIRQILADVGAEVSGFEEYARGPGAKQNLSLQQAAFDAGIFGVPTYVVGGQLYFGREHLPRVRWHLEGETGAPPDVSYPVPTEIPPGSPADALCVCVDFKSPQCYLAIAPTLAMAEELKIHIDWQPKLAPSPRRPDAPGRDADRGARHRYLRAECRARDLQRYAPHARHDLSGDFDSSHAAMGLLWLNQVSPVLAGSYVSAVFDRYWQRGETLEDLGSVRAILRNLGADDEAFARYGAERGSAALGACQEQLAARGAIAVPAYLLDDEVFIGRQHLPLIRARLSQRGATFAGGGHGPTRP